MGVYKTNKCSKDGKEKYISSFVSVIHSNKNIVVSTQVRKKYHLTKKNCKILIFLRKFHTYTNVVDQFFVIVDTENLHTSTQFCHSWAIQSNYLYLKILFFMKMPKIGQI